MAVRNNNLDGTDWSDGEVLNAEDLNDTFDESSRRLPPIGTVQAWLKDFTNTPSLPDNWAECNGQTIDDSDSPYDGQTIPDLNGDNKFLKGDTSSGTSTNAQEHHHRWYKWRSSSGYAIDLVDTTSDDGATWNLDGNEIEINSIEDSGRIEGDAYTEPEQAPEPQNYTVVWIMRIK